MNRGNLVAGMRRAGPIAIAGIVLNIAGVVVTVGIARLLTDREYGDLVRILGVCSCYRCLDSRYSSRSSAGSPPSMTRGSRRRGGRWLHRVRRLGMLALGLAAVLGIVLAEPASPALSLERVRLSSRSW